MSPQADDLKSPGSETFFHRMFKIYPRQLWTMFSHNLQWKLLALFLAILLWVGLILQDPSLTRERIFTDVPLNISGSDTLRRNGLIVTQGLEDENAIVKLKVDAPQQLYNDVTYSNYNPRIDLSKITEAGEQSVKVSTTSSSAYGTVTGVTPDSIPVVVDTYITNYRIPVHVEISGDYPEGYYGTTPTPDIPIVTVSGPESVLSQIARIVLHYDVSVLTAGTDVIQTALPLHYVNNENHELDDTLIEATSGGVLLRSIILKQELYPVKTLTLSQTALTTGSPKDGYEVKSITISPSVVIAAGDETTLSTLSTLFLEEAVDISDHDDTFTAEIKIQQPDNIIYMNSDTVVLVIDIGPVLVTETYEDIALSITDVPDGFSASTETSKVIVTLTGPELSMDSLRSSGLKASVSAAELTAGTYDLPVQLTLNLDNADEFTYTIAPQSVSVTVTED